MADFIMPETKLPIIVIILIIYSSYLSKDLAELLEHISGRIAIAISSSFYVSYLAFSLLICRARARACVLLRARPINWPSPRNYVISLTRMYTLTQVDTRKYTYIYIYIVRTCRKAIIRMALWAIITFLNYIIPLFLMHILSFDIFVSIYM